MKVGSLVRHYELIGLVVAIIDENFSEIFWTDPDEASGSTLSIWENCDFRVIK
tara:strand:- start:258 stop:416 length:159 start_codon:yes stop_codon:yes gene_type:complete